MGKWFSLDDDFVKQRFQWNGLSSSSQAPLYVLVGPPQYLSGLSYRRPQCSPGVSLLAGDRWPLFDVAPFLLG